MFQLNSYRFAFHLNVGSFGNDPFVLHSFHFWSHGVPFSRVKRTYKKQTV